MNNVMHELDIHYEEWWEIIEKIISWERELSFLPKWEGVGGIYKIPKTKQVIINEVWPRESDQAGGWFQPWNKRDMIGSAIKAGIPAVEVAFAAGVDMRTIDWAVSEFGRENTRLSALTGFFPEAIKEWAGKLSKAKNGGVHIFYPTQIHHIQAMLDKDGKTPVRDLQNQVLWMIEKNVWIARDNIGNVQFSPEIATDTDPVFLLESVRKAIENGATIINMPDTRWGTPTWYMEKLFHFIHWGTQDLQGKHDFIFSCHNHNDTGMAIANSIAAIRWWATQVESTFSGVGEWAGNAPTEQIINTLRQNGYDIGNIDNKKAWRIADYVRAVVYGQVVVPYGPWSDADGAWVHKDRWHKYIAWCKKNNLQPNPDFYRAGASRLNFEADRDNVAIGRLGGAGQVLHALRFHGVSRPTKKWPTVTRLHNTFCGDEKGEIGITQEIKVAYDANVFAEYLRNGWKLTNENISFDKNSVTISADILGTKIVIYQAMSADAGPIPTIIWAINKFLGKDRVKLHVEPVYKPIFTQDVAHQQFPDVHQNGTQHKDVEDAPLWAEVVVSVDGIHKKSRVKWQNTDETFVRAIFEACLHVIEEKIKE